METSKKAAVKKTSRSYFVGFTLDGTKVADYEVSDKRCYVNHLDFLVEVVTPISVTEPKAIAKVVLERK
jgi:hypothetical protein